MPWGKNLASVPLAPSSESWQLAGEGLPELAFSYSLDPHLPGCCLPHRGLRGQGFPASFHTCFQISQCPWLWLKTTDTATPISPAQTPYGPLSRTPPVGRGVLPTYSTFHASHTHALTPSPCGPLDSDSWPLVPTATLCRTSSQTPRVVSGPDSSPSGSPCAHPIPSLPKYHLALYSFT